MGHSIKDLENATKQISERIEQRSQERGEEFANNIIHRTSQGRGLWAFILWPSWIVIFTVSGIFLIGCFEILGLLDAPFSWIGLIGGFLFARTWYNDEFTIKHPFWSSMITPLAIVIVVNFIANFFGIYN
ncbi:hypothetical protein [Vibrio cholerae]|uniref:hypothetical protein n=1 Tax=Vibrio cholerae TaxID=666 RepID=UPI0011D7EC79|nr:hypothetical protein [Vibrio cholerae]MDX5049937.1 hypothetical protein [Vibrio cholerae]TXY78031.1 hypothetical protein FXE80_01345 [Vibrio cholerae]GIB16942.1 hypothetical protein VCSRO90_2855 [Vibrio cholerae]